MAKLKSPGLKSRASASKSEENEEAIHRALHLYKLYMDDKSSPKERRKEKEKGKKEKVNDADQVLETMIEALVRAQQEEDERRKNSVAVEAAKSDKEELSSVPHSSITSGFPNVIPLEAVNVSSLSTVAALNKQLQAPGRSLGLNDAIKLAASDARKNINFLKGDLVDLREGATSKAKTLKSLLKKRNVAEESEIGTNNVKKRNEKSVRLQDAAGRGEGPRDESRGETEEEARFRRLREMATRLNE